MAKISRPVGYSDIQEGIGQRLGWVLDLVQPNRSAAARLIGCSPSHLTKAIKGERGLSIFNVIAAANHFLVSTDFILRGKLDGLNPELRDRLVASHPELVLGRSDKSDS